MAATLYTQDYVMLSRTPHKGITLKTRRTLSLFRSINNYVKKSEKAKNDYFAACEKAKNNYITAYERAKQELSDRVKDLLEKK